MGSVPVVDAGDPDAPIRVAAVLQAGGAVVLPTDTIYGLAALASLPGATGQLFTLKGRSEQQPFAVLVADAAQAAELIEPPAAEVRRWMETAWPGALTLVLRRSTAARRLELGGDNAMIGVRCPAHGLIRSVATDVGPIATTSANRKGEPTPTTAAEAAAALTGPVALIVDGGPCEGEASTVIDASGPEPIVLRRGALALESLGLA